MSMIPALERPFAFLKPEHPLFALVQQARGLMQADPCSEAIGQVACGDQALTTRTLLKWHNGELRWFYFLLQSQRREVPLKNRALTIVYRPKKNRLELRRFPIDPFLPALPAYFERRFGPDYQECSAEDFTILRYVPQHRLTCRIQEPAGHAGFRIVKFIRQDQLSLVYEKLGRVSAAVRHKRPSFSVPTPLGLDADSVVFYQSCLAGHDLAGLICENNFEEMLFTVGSIHAEIHRLDVPAVPRRPADSIWEDLKKRVALISFLCPEFTSFLDEVYALLARQASLLGPTPWRFCHGDFGCQHVFKDGDRWSVLDFDGCLYGDPYEDMARVLAFLKYYVPFFFQVYNNPVSDAETILDRARRAYLRGYQHDNKTIINGKRLLWHRIASEVHYLAQTLRRDLFVHPIGFERAVRHIEALTAQLKSSYGNDW